jgi:hypothetical protein
MEPGTVILLAIGVVFGWYLNSKFVRMRDRWAKSRAAKKQQQKKTASLDSEAGILDKTGSLYSERPLIDPIIYEMPKTELIDPSLLKSAKLESIDPGLLKPIKLDVLDPNLLIPRKRESIDPSVLKPFKQEPIDFSPLELLDPEKLGLSICPNCKHIALVDSSTCHYCGANLEDTQRTVHSGLGFRVLEKLQRFWRRIWR